MKSLPLLCLIGIGLFGCHSGSQSPTTSSTARKDSAILSKASRKDVNGWIYLHLEGTPFEIGYQHGYLAAPEIDTSIQATAFLLQHKTHLDWSFYRRAAQSFLWNKLDREYKDEINGIVKGLQDRNIHYDSLDITAFNAQEELAYYYVPSLENAQKAHSADNKAPGNCSAFIATGSYTKDGKIVMGHNNWSDYLIGQHWNEIADIVPEHGHRILMDCIPGFIHSGDDFLETDAGILITETTITQFDLFDSTGLPEFMRARKAAQYANSIDDVVKIMVTGNNGGYANDWLIGDTKTNEVAKLELGLRDYRVWRSKDTAIIGSNFPSDPKLIREETTFNVHNPSSSPNARKLRMEKLVCVNMKGKLDVATAEAVEADHYDALDHKDANNRCVICGHIDEDPQGCKEWDEPPFYPMGAVQGKVTTSDLASKMEFWAHMGHP
ncbi:MAG: peptidase C45, partial [Bacteroidota bacterium]|nr:peptidase C45 [Bacteroidota bacterium]